MERHDLVSDAGAQLPSRSRVIARTAAVLLTTAALCLTLMAPGANAATKTTTAASIAVSASTVAPGASVAITATLKKGTSAFPGATISIQRKKNGTSTWFTLKSAKTDTAGRIKSTVSGINYNYDYRTVYAGSATTLASVSATAAVKVLQSVTIKSTSTTSPVAGDYVTLSGTTSAALKGRTAKLQMFSEGAWRTIATSTVSSLATFTVKGKTTLGGTRSYRVSVSSTVGVTGAASASKKFNIYSWFYLSDLPKVDSLRFGPQPVSSIAGKSYTRAVGNTSSFWWSAAPFAEYNLSFRCTRLEATIGLSDLSPSDLKVRMTTAVDNTEQDHGVVGIGEARTVSVDTNGAFRLKVQNHYVSGNSGTGSQGLWGNARILCLSQP